MLKGNVSTSSTASGTPVDDSTLPALAPVSNTQEALEGLHSLIGEVSKSFTQFSYGANAGIGRYLEFFPGISTDEAPLKVVGSFKITAIVVRTTATNATCTLEFRNIAGGLPGTLLHTLTFIANKEVNTIGSISSPVFTLPANGQLAIIVGSGSILKPHLYIAGIGG